MKAAPASPAWRTLVASASEPYRRSSRFACHFARGKLRWDPVFRHLVARGLISPRTRVLDIGCGQGLLASVLRAAERTAQSGAWPSDWNDAPVGVRVTGIELLPREVARARRALGGDADFVCADMRRTRFPTADTIVILDALHYVSRAEQDDILARARASLEVGGRLLVRVGNAASRVGYRLSAWVDGVVNVARGRQRLPRSGRPLGDWLARLGELGFDVVSLPMHRGTPFANVLLVGTVPGRSAAR